MSQTCVAPPGPGIEFFDAASGREMFYCSARGPNPLAGSILYRHPDGQWVSLRAASKADIDAISQAVANAQRPVKVKL